MNDKASDDSDSEVKKSGRFVRYRYVFKGIVLLVRRFPGSAGVIFVLSVLAGVMPAGQAWAAKRIIDDLVGRLGMAEPTSALTSLGIWLGIAFLLGLGAILVRWRLSVAQDWLQRARSVEVDRILLERTQEVDVLVRESPEFAHRQRLVQMGSGRLSSGLFAPAVSMGQTLIRILSFLGLLAAFSPGLALLSVVVAIPHGYLEMRYSRERFSLQRGLVKLRRRLLATRSLLTDPLVVHEIQRPDTYSHLKSRMLDEAGRARDREHGLEKKTQRRRALLGSAQTVMSFGVYAALAWQLLKGAITLGDVNLYRSAFGNVSGGVQTLGQSLSRLLASDLELEHLFRFLEGDRTSTATDERGALPFPDELANGLEVRDLSFRYPNMNRPRWKWRIGLLSWTAGRTHHTAQKTMGRRQRTGSTRRCNREWSCRPTGGPG